MATMQLRFASATSEQIYDVLHKAYRWGETRSKRRADYPVPINQYFKQLEFWKFFPVIATLATGIVASRHNPNLELSGRTTELLLLLSFAVFFLNIAYNLQEAIPEIAVVALLGGLSAVVASFHALVSVILPPSPVMIFGYVTLLLYNVYKIFKEDVRESIRP